MNSRKKYALIFFLCTITGIFFLFTKYNPNHYQADALRLSKGCETSVKSRTACLDMKLMEYTDSNPSTIGFILSAFWQLEQKGILHDDPRSFSDIAHMVGMKLIDKNIPLSTAIKYCSIDFKQACLHGAIMEYTDKTFASKIQPITLFSICNNIADKSDLIQNNCFHAAGHELQAKDFTTINATLDQCDTLSVRNAYACQTGIFMEYSKGNMGSGKHSKISTGTTRLPCSEVNNKYKSTCYTSEGSYRQYTPGQESFSQSYTFCSTVESNYSQACMEGVSGQLIFSTAGDYSKAETVCQGLDAESIRKACISTLAVYKK